MAIRNPRSHEQFSDQQQDAEAIIHFVDYLLRVIIASKESFTIESFLEAVTDSEFVETERYAEILISEVPANRRGDALSTMKLELLSMFIGCDLLLASCSHFLTKANLIST
ncbi:MAG: hypothetical protein IPH95_10060 [Candidatus Promineofilum sp.]|nr:hypothetical protein [Promineifilum sp.]